MKFFKIRFRDKTKTEIDASLTWEVRWESRHGYYHGDTTEQVRVFTEKEDAENFKAALEDAFKLIKTTAENKVTLTKRDSH